jgi:hypothetical protein
MAFEFGYRGIQPDRFAQVKFITDLIYRVKDLMGAGIPGIIADHGILQQMVVLKDFGP